MIVGVLKEVSPETRVSLLAEGAAQLIKKNIKVWVESGAGLSAYCSDNDYLAVGAEIKTASEIASTSDIILSIDPPSIDIHPGAVLIGMYQARFEKERIKQWLDKGLIVYSMELLPRTTRAQSMDVLSSQANIAGYKPGRYETFVLPQNKPVKQEMIITHAQFMPQDYPFMYPCTTLYPKNSDYTKTKYIVTQP